MGKPSLAKNATLFWQVGEDRLIKELRKAFPTLEVSDEDEVVDITATEWWKKMEATSQPGALLWAYRDSARLTLERLSKMRDFAKPHLSEPGSV